MGLARADTEAGLVGCLAAGPGSFFLPRNRRVTANLARQMTDLAREARDLTAQDARFEPTPLELQVEAHTLFCSKLSTNPRQSRITLDERS